MNSYKIGFWTNNQLMFLLNVDAESKKDAKNLAEDVRKALLPLLISHYQAINLRFNEKLKIVITDY